MIGIELITIDARIVIASVDTYLRFAEAVNRLDLTQAEAAGLKELRDGGGGDGADNAKVSSKGRRRRSPGGTELMAVQSPLRTGAEDVSAAALYCYGITSAKAAQLQPAAGLGGTAVEPVRLGGLAALTSEVPAGTVRARGGVTCWRTSTCLPLHSRPGRFSRRASGWSLRTSARSSTSSCGRVTTSRSGSCESSATVSSCA